MIDYHCDKCKKLLKTNKEKNFVLWEINGK